MAPGAPWLPVGGPMSAHGANFLEAKRKKLKSRLNLFTNSDRTLGLQLSLPLHQATLELQSVAAAVAIVDQWQ